MFGLSVPIITTVIGEGGSGGALAIGCCDKMLMLENAVYYVARYAKISVLVNTSYKEDKYKHGQCSSFK